MIPYEFSSGIKPFSKNIQSTLGSVILIENNTNYPVTFHFIKNETKDIYFVFKPFEKRYFLRYPEDNYSFVAYSDEKSSSSYYLKKRCNDLVLYDSPCSLQIAFFYKP